MKLPILKARIKRNNLEDYAGNYFRDETSIIVKTLNENGKEALVGIQNEDGIYTILGRDAVYYSTKSGAKGEIPLAVFSTILSANGISKGKVAAFEYVKVNEENELIWLHNRSTMESLWNIVLLLESYS